MRNKTYQRPDITVVCTLTLKPLCASGVSSSGRGIGWGGWDKGDNTPSSRESDDSFWADDDSSF